MLYYQHLCQTATEFQRDGLFWKKKEFQSKERTTQGDPTAMAAYTLGVTPLIHFLLEYVSMNNLRCKEVAFADGKH